MGYTTDFNGEFELDKPLEQKHIDYLTAFSGTRRMARHVAVVETYPDPVREIAGLPVGAQGGYYVGDRGADLFNEVNDRASIIDYNHPPDGQPGLWCQWIPDESGSSIVWDEGEKFYEYTAWLIYIIEHFLDPWGYKLNGEVYWQGEDSEDRGCIIVKDNRVGVRGCIIEYGDVEWQNDTPATIDQLIESLEHTRTNLTSIDTAMRNAAVPGSVAQAAWECADRHLNEALELARKLNVKPDNVWGEDHHHSRADWQYEVANGDTTLGYWEWVANMKEQDSE